MLQGILSFLRVALSRKRNATSRDDRAEVGDFISPRPRKNRRLPFTQWADVSRTERFICVAPLSGYRIIQLEDDGYVIYLDRAANDDALGRALLEALARSRFIFPPDPAFSEAERYMQCYRNWQKDFMQRYGYKTKRDAYKNWDWCRAKRSEGRISIQSAPERRTGVFSRPSTGKNHGYCGDG
jgi:CDI immunity protein